MVFLFKSRDFGGYKKTVKASVVAIAVTVASLSFQTIADAKDNQVKTIYHVYKDNAFLGNITENQKEELDTYLEEELAEVQKVYPDYEMAVDEDVLFIPEQVFQSIEEDAETLELLKNEIHIEAKAASLVIDGEQVLTMANEEEVEQLVKSYKLQYMTEEELQQYESNQDNLTEPLTSVGSRITDIVISKELEVADTTAVPNDLLTVEEALSFLNTGVKEETAYVVKEGDVLGSIANDHDLATEELIALNPELTEDVVLQIDQEINVTVNRPLFEITIAREIYEIQPIAFETEVEETASLNKGESEVKQAGQNGENTVHYTAEQTNGVQVTQFIISENVTKEPVTEVVLEGTKTPSVGTGDLVWPTVGGYISSEQGPRWGKYHKGIDIARPSNRTIKAADNGVVESAGYDNGGYGNKVVINHNNGMKTVYAHLDSISVTAGQVVEAGSSIGVMGSTGNSTGVHLHFEVYKNGALVNPLDYL